MERVETGDGYDGKVDGGDGDNGGDDDSPGGIPTPPEDRGERPPLLLPWPSPEVGEVPPFDQVNQTPRFNRTMCFPMLWFACVFLAYSCFFFLLSCFEKPTNKRMHQFLVAIVRSTSS